jgi:hypothetical protein
MTTSFRAAAPIGAPIAASLAQLGPLAQLPGTWVGSGFNLISLPDKHDNKPFRLKLNATKETLDFNRIGAPIPNRGSAQDDIEFLGLHYLQQVSDAVTNEALHIEPGIWLNVPATTEPAGPASVVRLATIPHGDSLVAQGPDFTVAGGPQIDVISSTPTNANTGQPIADPNYLAPFSATPLPPRLPPLAPGSIANPNLVLTDAIQGQNIVSTVVLTISTAPNGGIVNIPFVVTNANAIRLDAIFWIETVERPNGIQFLQLQYTQTVILNFLDINWPHISVATLLKQ